MEWVTIYGTNLPQRRPVKEVISLQWHEPQERAFAAMGGSSEETDGHADSVSTHGRRSLPDAGRQRAFRSEASALLGFYISSVACLFTCCRLTGPALGAFCRGTACPPGRGSVNGHFPRLSLWWLPAPCRAVGNSAPGGRAPSRPPPLSPSPSPRGAPRPRSVPSPTSSCARASSRLPLDG